jgi:magnesium transporter
VIRGFAAVDGRLTEVADPLAGLDTAVWLDVVDPTGEEEGVLEARLGVDIPTREEMEEIEVSSRLYQETGAIFMTASLPARTDADDFWVGPVTFALIGRKLVTVRYHEPRAFRTFPQRAEKADLGCNNGEDVMIALLDAIVDRLADVLERVQREVGEISRGVFQSEVTAAAPRRELNDVLRLIGRKGDLSSSISESLVSLQRVAGFFGQVVEQRGGDRGLGVRLKTLAHDIQSLSDYTDSLAQKITFLLDATLGMITIEQSNIIKIFTIAAVVLLPPTLIASIYGMNFRHIPELDWRFGYPFAFAMMVVSALIPWWFFKRRGWI